MSGDGRGVVSHAGCELLRELAEDSGLVEAVTSALADTYAGPWTHAPGRVFTDLAVALADGADCVRGIETLTHRGRLFGPVASDTTAWRLLERVDAAHLPGVRAARAAARQAAWDAGAAPEVGSELVLDFDATVVVAHAEKEDARATWKKTFGFHPLLCFLDRPEVAGGEALAGLLRAGNAGSNTAADHVTVLELALSQLPESARPRPQDPDGPRVLARSDSAGATHAFAAACRERGVGFSFGFPIDTRVQTAVAMIEEECWQAAINTDGTIRDGAWVAEATALLDLSAWPESSRLILRKERPHPGAQLSFTDADGMRITAFLTDTAPRVVPNQLAGIELRHRQHARVEDRIREAKATGLRNLPCHSFAFNTAWVELVLTATDLTTWTKLLCFRNNPALAKAEIATLRYRVLHTAARLATTARQTHLRLDNTWTWTPDLVTAWQHLRTAFP